MLISTGESAAAELFVKNGNSNVNVKSEAMDEDMDSNDNDESLNNNSFDSQMDLEDAEQVQELGPAALGLQRVGTKPPPKPKANPPQPVQVLNRRGMPARIRKKNKLFYDDALVNHPHHRYVFKALNMYPIMFTKNM